MDRYDSATPAWEAPAMLALTTISLALIGLIGGTLLGLELYDAARLGLALVIIPWALIAGGGLLRVLRLAKRLVVMEIEPVVGRDLDGDGYQGRPPVQEAFKLLPVHIPPHVRLAGEENGFRQDDLVWMIEQLPRRGVSWQPSGRSPGWQGVTLPSGKVLTEYADFRAFPDLLSAAGILVNRRQRASGNLTTTDPDEIRAKLRV